MKSASQYRCDDEHDQHALVDRTPIVKPTPARMLGAGLFYLPADRVAEGLAMSRSIRENVAVSAINFPEFSRFGLVREGAERIAVTRATAALQVRPTDIRSVVSGMSGGNRQKLLLACYKASLLR